VAAADSTAAETVYRPNRVPWIVGGVLLAGFLIGGLLAGGEEVPPPPPVPNPPESARALSVNTNRERLLVVSPCGEPVQETARQAREGRAPTGATRVLLPEAGGDRTILVPHCQDERGVTASGTASAAVVAASGRQLPEVEGGGLSAGPLAAKSQVILPGGSSASIVVIPPCEPPVATQGRDAILPLTSEQVVTAPSC
jgi:hypothetical protein